MRTITASSPSSRLSSRESATSRCCAPSWRLRSSRCRSLSATSTIRAREPRSSSRRARSSTCSRVFSSAMPAAAVTAASSSGSSSSDGSCSNAATGAPCPVDHRHRAPIVSARQLHGPAVVVGVGSEVGQPVRERQRRVTQRARQRVAEIRRRGMGPQPDDELAHGRAGQSRVEEADQEGERSEADDEEGDPSDRLERDLPAGHAEHGRQEEEGNHEEPQRERVDEQHDRAAQWPARRSPPEGENADSDQAQGAECNELNLLQPKTRLGRGRRARAGCRPQSHRASDRRAGGRTP